MSSNSFYYCASINNCSVDYYFTEGSNHHTEGKEKKIPSQTLPSAGFYEKRFYEKGFHYHVCVLSNRDVRNCTTESLKYDRRNSLFNFVSTFIIHCKVLKIKVIMPIPCKKKIPGKYSRVICIIF